MIRDETIVKNSQRALLRNGATATFHASPDAPRKGTATHQFVRWLRQACHPFRVHNVTPIRSKRLLLICPFDRYGDGCQWRLHVRQASEGERTTFTFEDCTFEHSHGPHVKYLYTERRFARPSKLPVAPKPTALSPPPALPLPPNEEPLPHQDPDPARDEAPAQVAAAPDPAVAVAELRRNRLMALLTEADPSGALASFTDGLLSLRIDTDVLLCAARSVSASHQLIEALKSTSLSLAGGTGQAMMGLREIVMLAAFLDRSYKGAGGQ